MSAPIVLFWDIDGTLLSTARAGIHAWEQAVVDVLGTQFDFEDFPTAGRTDSQIAAAVAEACGVEPSRERVSRMLRSYEEHLPDRLGWRQGRVLPNVRAILDDLVNDPNVVSLLLTGNTAAGARAKLTHYDLIDDFRLEDGAPSGAFCADGDDRDADRAARPRRGVGRDRLPGPWRRDSRDRRHAPRRELRSHDRGSHTCGRNRRV